MRQDLLELQFKRAVARQQVIQVAVKKAVAAVTPPPAERPRPLLAPPLQGDLSLEIRLRDFAGKGLKPSVLFHDYPRKRHSVPMSMAEHRRARTLTPKVARLDNDTMQVVIEVAADGVYEFRAVTEGGQNPEAECVLTVTDGGKKKHVSSTRRRRLDNASIVRILMPEGLLWDDDSSFSGNMEDADSVTKYNAETGLVWKVYK